MIKKIFLLLLINFLFGCSIDNKSGIWNKKKLDLLEAKNQEVIFKKTETFNKEFNNNIRIKLKENFFLGSFINNNKNNNKILNYDGNFNKISSFKFSKHKNFKSKNSQLLITKDKNIIFFDKRGAIFKIDKNFKLIWKKNIYSKKQKKLNPSLNFSNSNDTLIITDNLSYIYALNMLNGELMWKTKNYSAFNSEIKIINKKIYTVDFDNILRCFSLDDGIQLWEYRSENTFIKSTKKISLVLDNEKVIFINSVGDINALDLNNGNLIWQTPTQGLMTNLSSFSIIYSDLVLGNKNIYLSNNKNEMFAIDSNTGTIIWKQNISSNLRSTVINKMIFIVSNNGYLIILDKDNGNILRSTNIKKNIKKFNNSSPVGFIIAKNRIYLTLDNGYLIKINILDGMAEENLKIDNNFISRPYIFDKELYILSNNKILKYN